MGSRGARRLHLLGASISSVARHPFAELSPSLVAPALVKRRLSQRPRGEPSRVGCRPLVCVVDMHRDLRMSAPGIETRDLLRVTRRARSPMTDLLRSNCPPRVAPAGRSRSVSLARPVRPADHPRLSSAGPPRPCSPRRSSVGRSAACVQRANDHGRRGTNSRRKRNCPRRGIYAGRLIARRARCRTLGPKSI